MNFLHFFREISRNRQRYIAILFLVLLLLGFHLHFVYTPKSAFPIIDLGSRTYSTDLRSGDGRCDSKDCIVTLYSDFSAVEFSYMIDLLSLVKQFCNCRVELRARVHFCEDLISGRINCAAILHATAQASKDEEDAMRANEEKSHLNVILFHLSDEHEKFAVSAYGLVKTVFRNYLAVSKDRVSDVSYLLLDDGGMVQNNSQKLWFPLGPGNFLTTPASILNQPSQLRPIAWSWAGSVAGEKNVPREAFLKGVHSYKGEDLSKFGLLHVFRDFLDSNGLRPSEYSAWLYLSRVAPCPDGGSAEQFRIWEAFIAGAIPIVSAARPHLAYLDQLGFQVLCVKNWFEEPSPILHAAAFNSTFIAQLEKMRLHNLNVLNRTMQRLKKRIANEVCTASVSSSSLQRT